MKKFNINKNNLETQLKEIIEFKLEKEKSCYQIILHKKEVTK